MLSSAEGPVEDTVLQVMSPSAPATHDEVPQRAEATYGSAVGLPNGVARQGTEASQHGLFDLIKASPPYNANRPYKCVSDHV